MQKQDLNKLATPTAMAALIEEHADHYGGAERLAVLMDKAMHGREWNYLHTMLSLDVLDGLEGKAGQRAPGDLSELDGIDEGAPPPHGDFR